MGFERSDDAGVFKINDECALVQTLDFFTPIVDDPFVFGQIAAANALSDVYAMGGKPLTAMNICAFPADKFPLSMLAEIINGALGILKQADVQLLGGHTVQDNELKYGLSVTGCIHPDKILKNHGLKESDVIVLTKPLGTGIISTAIKANMIEPNIIKAATDSMTTLNRMAAEIMQQYNVHACTDVTGFGLAGHLREMLADDNLHISIDSKSLPVLPGVEDACETGLVPAGLYRNRDYNASMCDIGEGLPLFLKDIIFDPQTSGGLLIALSAEEAEKFVNKLKDNGISAAIIATVEKASEQRIIIF